MIKSIHQFLDVARSADSHRVILTVVAEDSGPDGTYRVATDTHRLHIFKVDGEAKEPATRFLYPEGTVLDLDPKHQYPNWRRIIPEQHEHTARVNIRALDQALRTIGSHARHNANRALLKFGKSNLEITSNVEEVGSAVAVVACEYTGEAFRIAVNYRYLMEALPKPGPIGSPSEVEIGFTLPSRPITVTYGEDGPWSRCRAIIMPMALLDTPDKPAFLGRPKRGKR